MTDDDAPKYPAELIQAMASANAAASTGVAAPEVAAPDDAADSATGQAGAGQDLLSRLAWRLCTEPDVTPRLGLRFAPTPDLPDDETARWRREWRAEPVK